MKQLILFILFVGISFIQIQAQSPKDTVQTIQSAESIKPVYNEYATKKNPANDSITINPVKGDIKGYQNGFLLSMPDYKNIFKDNPEALHQIKVANFDYKVGLYMDYIGGFTFGYCLGSAINGTHLDASWGLTLAASAAVVGTGFIIYNSGKMHHRKAIDIYNSPFRKYNLKETGELKVGITNDGLGFAYRF
ncbi:MAG: hypothetical protein P4L34_11210 [Paludibacter sp.]|nr:hypothetical protein [Paludibacter sp.]